MRFLTVVLIVALAFALGWAWLFGPYWMDYFRMKDVAGSAVLSWAAFDERKGHLELETELRRREIPDYFRADSCRFYKEPGDVKVVDCAWAVDVVIPVVAQTRRLSFQVKQSATKDGRLVE